MLSKVITMVLRNFAQSIFNLLIVITPQLNCPNGLKFFHVVSIKIDYKLYTTFVIFDQFQENCKNRTFNPRDL